VAGCNGAGKTTASYTILPEILNCREFVNADEIARGLSPFQPEKVSVEAGRLMLKRMIELLQNNESFAFETTLATKYYRKTIAEAKQKGYDISLLFIWLPSVDLAKSRVDARVAAGGHNVEANVIERRYFAGMRNLFDIYIPICDSVLIIDNSLGKPEVIAKKIDHSEIIIIDNLKFNKLKSYDSTTEK
jgi:predicted ABC-type ATPase